MGQKEGEEMTKDEIEKLAVEAGWPLFAIQMLAGTEDEKRLKRFAELVAAAEREACAELLEENAKLCVKNKMLHEILEANASAIRARGNA